MEGVVVLGVALGVISALMIDINSFVMVMTYGYLRFLRRRKHRLNARRYNLRRKVARQLDHMDYSVSFSNETCEDHLRMKAGESVNINDESSSTVKVKGKGTKRRKRDDVDQLFISTMTTFCDKMNSTMSQIAYHMGDIAQRVGTDFDATRKRQLIYDSLGKLAFLSLETRVRVARYLCNNSNLLDLFFSLPDDAKAVMVTNIIKEVGCGGCGSI